MYAPDYERVMGDVGYWKERAYQAEMKVLDEDKTWLRTMATAAMAAEITALKAGETWHTENALYELSVKHATALLAEIKKVEEGK